MTDMDSGELAEAAFAALAGRDFDGFLELMDPDVEFTSLIAEAEAKLYCGHVGVRQFLDQMLSVFPDWRPTVESAESHGDSALVKVRFEGTGAGSGMTIEQVGWQVAHARNGKVTGWCFFRTEEEARDALRQNLSAGEVAAGAGGSEPPRSPRRLP